MFPAWAGMNRLVQHVSDSVERVPRVGGDEPVLPRSRMAQAKVFPAQAGMNRPSCSG
uniref:Uncharacterized protein n=1 Tax=Ralstonia solanacearum TaxID=305 RepID=A0A0S4TQ24_RALSL|nr:conserved protein of unknown function [Ralstonia solanacearum]